MTVLLLLGLVASTFFVLGAWWAGAATEPVTLHLERGEVNEIEVDGVRYVVIAAHNDYR